MVPVATVHVGCAVTVAAGVAGCAFTVILVTDELTEIKFNQ
jgi:hypothetical protein